MIPPMILGAPSQGRDDTAVRGKNWSNGRIYDGYEELFNSGCVSRQAQTAGLDARQPHHGESSVLKTLYDFNTFQPLRDAPESPSLSQASLASTRMIEWSPDRTASHHVSPPVMPDFPREERGSLVVEAQAPAIQPPPRASRRNSEGAVCAFRQFPPHIHIEGQELGQQAPSAQQEGPQQHPLPASSPSLQGSTTPKVPRVLFAGKRRSLTDLPSSPVGALTAPQREPEAPGAKGEDRREFWLRESVGGIGILLTDCLAGMKIRKVRAVLPPTLAESHPLGVGHRDP